MSVDTTGQSGMTCGKWIALGVFIVLGVFGLMMFNFISGMQENRQERVQSFFNRMVGGSYDVAFDMIALDWQTILENKSGLEQTFAGMTITHTTFGLEMGSCYTNTRIIKGERRPTTDSQQYMYTAGTARLNGKEVNISVNMTYEGNTLKILGIEIDGTYYGADVPDGCISTS